MSESQLPRGVSRRGVLRSGAVVGAAAAVAGASAASPAQATGNGGGDRLAFVNGRIHTMDRRDRVESAVLIEDGVFVDVGRQRRHARREGRQPARPYGRAGSRRTARPHRQPRQPARLPHDPGEHDVDRRGPARAARRRRGVPSGAVGHLDGRLPRQPVGRTPHAHARRARRGRPRPPGPAVHPVHRAVRDQQPRQGVLRRGRRRPAAAPAVRAGQRRRRRPHRRGRLRRRRLELRAVPAAGPADPGGQAAQRAGHDGVLGQRRADHAPRPGAVPDAGAAVAHPGAVQPGPLPDVRLAAPAAPRGPDDDPDAVQLPAQPGRSRAAGAEGAAAQPVPVLRRRHDA